MLLRRGSSSALKIVRELSDTLKPPFFPTQIFVSGRPTSLTRAWPGAQDPGTERCWAALMLCCHHLEILNFWTRNSTFSPDMGPTNWIAGPVFRYRSARMWWLWAFSWFVPKDSWTGKQTCLQINLKFNVNIYYPALWCRAKPFKKSDISKLSLFLSFLNIIWQVLSRLTICQDFQSILLVFYRNDLLFELIFYQLMTQYHSHRK